MNQTRNGLFHKRIQLKMIGLKKEEEIGVSYFKWKFIKDKPVTYKETFAVRSSLS